MELIYQYLTGPRVRHRVEAMIPPPQTPGSRYLGAGQRLAV
ncbi:MAG: hypothetical protein V5B39_18050 [Accumulibacter sp.]|jgi:hypothetical protein